MSAEPPVSALGPLETALDHAHDAMIRGGESDAARRSFFAAVAAAEVILVLEAEVPEGSDQITPMVLETEDGPIVLGFDTESRMAGFLGQGAATATVSGRALAQMLAPVGLGLGLNLDVAPSAILLPASVMVWLAELAPPQAAVREGQIVKLDPPRDVDPVLLQLLDARLAMLAGTAKGASLAQAQFAQSGAALVLALTEVPQPAQPAVSQMIAEALSMAGQADASLDVLFVDASSETWARFARIGLQFEIPAVAIDHPQTPGQDPDQPPILR